MRSTSFNCKDVKHTSTSLSTTRSTPASPLGAVVLVEEIKANHKVCHETFGKNTYVGRGFIARAVCGETPLRALFWS